MPPENFTLPYSPAAVDDLRERLRKTRWIDEIEGAHWDYGFDLAFLRDICEYWSSEFDWKQRVNELSCLPHYRLETNYGKIHFLHVRGRGPSPIPLILTHGWPGSFLEMLRILPLLTDPASTGGDASDSFDVVVPSLPGYGFSDRPTSRGMNIFRVAELWVELMQELGYERFGAQGGDIGAGVTTALGLRHSEHMIGIHLNFLPGSFRPHLEPETLLVPEEKAFLNNVSRWSEANGGYSHIQRTRPQTAAYGLNDSPAALAAWILEKFRDWSDCGRDLYSRFTPEELLTNVTLYWMTGTIHSSFRMYYENSRAPLHFGPNDLVRVPCGFARFPKEIVAPPRPWIERGYNIERWSDLPRGGHFAAAEEPQLLAEDLRAFFRPLRHAG